MVTCDPRGQQLDVEIGQGKTFARTIRWEKEPYVYAAIASIAKQAPMRVVTQAPHGLPDGWRAAVVSAQGMREANAKNSPPLDSDFHRATAIDANTLEFNDVNAADFTAHVAGTGYVQAYTPASLAGCTARMQILDQVGGQLLYAVTSLVCDDAAKTITVTIPATDTANFDWTSGVYDLEVQDANGVVTGLFWGSVTVDHLTA